MKGGLDIYQGTYESNPSFFTNSKGLIAHTDIWEYLRGSGQNIGDLALCEGNDASVIKVQIKADNKGLLVSEERGTCIIYKKEFNLGADINLPPNDGLEFFSSSHDMKHVLMIDDAAAGEVKWFIDQNRDLNIVQSIDKESGAPKKSASNRTLAIYKKLE